MTARAIRALTRFDTVPCVRLLDALQNRRMVRRTPMGIEASLREMLRFVHPVYGKALASLVARHTRLYITEYPFR